MTRLSEDEMPVLKEFEALSKGRNVRMIPHRDFCNFAIDRISFYVRIMSLFNLSYMLV